MKRGVQCQVTDVIYGGDREAVPFIFSLAQSPIVFQVWGSWYGEVPAKQGKGCGALGL